MSDRKREVQEYLAANVNTFIEPLVYDIVKKRPTDPVQHAQQWLTNYIAQRKGSKKELSHSAEQQQSAEGGLSDSDNDDVEEIPFDESKLQKKKLQGKTRSRMGISEEVFGSFNKKESVQLKSVPKDQEVKLLILSLIRNSILFQNVDYKDEEILINAMEERKASQDETIITEGEAGDALYIVETGEYDCYKVINGEEKLLKTYKHGDAFGELALMYNAPRAATIKVKVPGTLYSLDRITFSQVVKNAATKKRELYRKVIDGIDIFAEVNPYEKEQFYDVLKEERFEEGQHIIKQGESGNKFYIVIEGNLVAEKKEQNDEFPRIVYQYKEGDYFGELALVHDIDRQASVKAVNRVRVASINRDSFKRMLGSFEEILKRNEQKYNSFQEQKAVCA